MEACHTIDTQTRLKLNNSQKAEVEFRSRSLPECEEYKPLQQFLYPVQQLIIQEIREAETLFVNGDEARHFVQLSCHCQFFRKYRLPCRHIFYADTIWSGTITEDHWKQFAWLFDESGFEIYETWASIDCPDDVFDEEMGVPARRKLAMWEVLEQVRVNFFGLEEALVSQELALEDVNKLMEGWIRSL